MSISWIFDMIKYLLKLWVRYQENFKYVVNYKHLDIWNRIVIQVSFNSHILITSR